MVCPDCGGESLIQRGPKNGFQRYMCRACNRYCTDKPPRFSAQTKAMTVKMYLNSSGIRAIGRVLDASPAAVLNWIRKHPEAVSQHLAEQAQPAPCDQPDIIAMDEIYSYVGKKASGSHLDRL